MPSQVRKGIGNLFDTFDKTPFLPKKCKKGKGRKIGTKTMKRKTYKTYKKPKKRVKNSYKVKNININKKYPPQK